MTSVRQKKGAESRGFADRDAVRKKDGWNVKTPFRNIARGQGGHRTVKVTMEMLNVAVGLRLVASCGNFLDAKPSAKTVEATINELLSAVAEKAHRKSEHGEQTLIESALDGRRLAVW